VTVGSLFTGVGGFDLGFERAGFTVAWQVERDAAAQKVLRHRWPTVPLHDDVRVIVGGEMPGTLKKLTQPQVDEAVRLYQRGFSLARVSAYYSVSRQSMWDLLRRRIELRSRERVGKANHFYRGGGTQDDRAQNLAEKAIKRGVLIRPDTCSQCGVAPPPYKDGRSGIQAHHDDYNRPLDVRWLCQACHHAWHQVHTPIAREEVPMESVDVLVGGFP
jgi:predicted DNA-binding protein YlxM (UPF0122 family)